MKQWKQTGAKLLGAAIAAAICFSPYTSMPVRASVQYRSLSGNNIADVQADYCEMLETYGRNARTTYSLNDDEKRKISDIVSRTKDTIRNLKEEQNVISTYSDATSQIDRVTSDAKARHDKQVTEEEKDKLPSSSSDYIIPGNYWVTPEAHYGQEVIVCLPIVNMFKYDVTNVVVTPQLTNDHKTSPFEIGNTNYALQFDTLQGSDTNSDVIARTRNLFWTFKTREDVLHGYYKVEYKVLYTNVDNKQETATISTFVKAVGKPDAKNVDGSEEEEEKTLSTPRIIITGFETSPEEVYAGSTFALTLHVKNASKRTSVTNIEFNLEAAVEGKDNDTTYSAFLPESGSNTLYVDSIPPGGTTDLTIEMSAKADLVQKPYALKVNMKYEDAKYNPYENTSSVSIPVKQASKFDSSSVEVMPADITVGSESNVMFSIYNTGKTKLYNVQVKFTADSVTGGDAFVGNLESGATGNVDAMLTGAAPTMDDGTVKAIITYEDDTGKQFTSEKEFTLFVTEAMPEDMNMGMEDMLLPEEQASGLPIWAIAAIAVAAAAVVIAAVIIIKKRKKKKALSLLEDEDDED